MCIHMHIIAHKNVECCIIKLKKLRVTVSTKYVIQNINAFAKLHASFAIESNYIHLVQFL